MENTHWFKNRALGLQLLFILIIVYAVSTAFVLGLALGILPYLHYKLYLKENTEYAIISFVLTAVISVYHLSVMFRLNKRRTDGGEEARPERIHWFKDRVTAMKILFILIALYIPLSAAALTVILRAVPNATGIKLPYICISYAIISFVLAALISAHHLSTMIRRRKRKTDQAAFQPA
ncbi:MAG: hypothetical protein LBD31_07610 [Treponema sp.]|jgi:membrane protein implicated in regulation of membrane protease activity|nr:hypothetical protein [Treponema sp.]